MQRLNVKITALLLLGIFAILAVSSIWPDRKSPTCDELAHHIPVGYVLLTKGDFKMDTSQPPLPRYIVALPLKLFMDLKMPQDKTEWRRADRSEFGKDFFYRYNNQPKKMIFLGRLAIIAIGILCGFILFIWAKMLYGEKVALFSLFLYVFSPNILAHSVLATTDMTATCFILLAVVTFWLFIKNASLTNMLFAGICLGLAQLSKYTAILLYVTFLLLLLFELPGISRSLRKNMLLKFSGIIIISILTLWAGYGFDFQPILKDAMRIQEKLDIAHNISAKVLPSLPQSLIDSFLLRIPFPLEAHLLGILGVFRHGYEGHGTYFLGSWSRYGNPLYYLLAFLIKTPIPVLLFLLSGLLVTFRHGIKRNERFILITVILLFLTASLSKLQLGLRYILPIYPFCFMIAGRSIELFKKKSLNLFMAALGLWYVISCLWAWPHYLSYFNEFIGGPKNGYKYLRDSNIDWGQDLPELAKYMKDNDITEVKLLYFGTADPGDYGIKYEPLTDSERITPGEDAYAISAQYLERTKWSREYKPDAQLGYSIFIYDLRSSERS